METQYQKNDIIRYGNNGICIIEDITMLNICNKDEYIQYYILQPINDSSGKIYVPTENKELTAKIKYCLSKEQIDALLDSFKYNDLRQGFEINQEADNLWIRDRKLRNNVFSDIIARADHKELISLVGCIYSAKQELLAHKKKLSYTDESFLRKAEVIIVDEFSYVLKLPADKVGEYIRNRLGIEEVSDFIHANNT